VDVLVSVDLMTMVSTRSYSGFLMVEQSFGITEEMGNFNLNNSMSFYNN